MTTKKLTKKEKSALTILTISKNPIKNTMSRLKISRSMVYKYINILKDKGHLKGSIHKGYTKAMLSPHPPPTCAPLLRLHGQEFHITLNQTTRHRRKVIAYKGSTIIIYPNSIRVFSKDNEFRAYSVSECLKESFKFWDLFFIRIEESFKVRFYKEGRDNIEMVNAHVEEYNSETGKWVKRQGVKRLQVRGTNDGIVWMEYDKSKKGTNIEVKHPKEALNDAELIFDEVFNSWRDGKALTPNQTTKAISDLVMVQKHHAENIKSHIKAIQELAGGVKALVKLTKAKKQSRVMYQRNLNDWRN